MSNKNRSEFMAFEEFIFFKKLKINSRRAMSQWSLGSKFLGKKHIYIYIVFTRTTRLHIYIYIF